MASNRAGRDKAGIVMALGAEERGLDTPPQGCTGLSIGANRGAKNQDRHHSDDLLSDYP